MTRIRNPSFILGAIGFLAALLCLAYYVTRPREIQPIYRIGYTNSPPMLLAHGDGSPGGLAYDVMTAAAARAEIRLDWRLAHKVNHEFLREGAADLWPLGDAEYSHGFGVTKAWAHGPYAMLWMADSPNGEMRVAVNKSPRVTGLLAKYSPGAIQHPVDNAVAAMAAVCAGEATHAFLDARVAQRLLLTRPKGCQGALLRMEPAVGAELPLGIMYRPGFERAAQKLRSAIDEMALDGSLAYIFSRWSSAAYSSVELDGLLLESRARAKRFEWLTFSALLLLSIAIAAAATLYRARNLAREAATVKSNFVAMVSHELRTPLNGFLGTAELLAAGPLAPEQMELVEAIRASALNFQRAVNHILEFSRIETGKLHIETAPCDLMRVAAEALAVVERRAESKGLETRLISSGEMPAVIADSARIKQVLINLLENAVKFTQEGSITLRVNASEIRSGSKLPVSIQVSDTGIGIDSETASRLFTPFRQAQQSQSRRFGGLGLGLAVSKGIVEAMGGEIALSSEPGLGTTVTVSLQFDISTDPAPGEWPPPRAAAARLRVLVVDDGRVNRLLATRILRSLGHLTDEAANGREAVELASAGGYALILMDCQMPEMDGFEATRRIRSAEAGGRRVPIVALTASVEPVDQGLCFRAGMDGFVQKPVSFQNLRQVLEKYASLPSK